MRLSAATLSKIVFPALASAAALILAMSITPSSTFAGPSLYSFTLNSVDGKPAPLAEYKGKVVLLVNVASQCGYTPQYSALEAIY